MIAFISTRSKLVDYQISDKVRVTQVPPYLYGNDPIAQETAEFFERCLDKVFVVEVLMRTDSLNCGRRAEVVAGGHSED